MICGREMKTNTCLGDDALGCWFCLFIYLYRGRYPTLLFFLFVVVFFLFSLSIVVILLWSGRGFCNMGGEVCREADKEGASCFGEGRCSLLFWLYVSYRSKDGGGGGELLGMISQVEEMDDLMMKQKPI